MLFGWFLNDVVIQGNKRFKMFYYVFIIISWDINDFLVVDFDGFFFGLGFEFGIISYNMR